MPLPPIVVDVTPPAAVAEYQSVMLAACSESLSDGTCTDQQGQEVSPRARASVRWSADHLVVSVRVVFADQAGREPLGSELRFRLQDAELERWRAVGVIIPTLVGAWEAKREAKAPAPPSKDDHQPVAPKAPPKAPPPQQAIAPAAPSRILGERWLGLVGLTGPGLERGAWRVGASVLFGQQIASTPLLAVASMRYAARAGGEGAFSTNWADVGVGIGGSAQMASQQLRLSSELEFVLNRFHVSAKDEQHQDAGDTWASGLRLRLTATWPSRAPFAIVAGGEAWGLSKATTIRVGGQPVGELSSVGFDVLMGARYFFR